MREVSDLFLLNMAEISAALVGLFLVGVFFFVERGFTRAGRGGAMEGYFRSGTRIVFVLFAIPLFVPLTLVAMNPVWSHLTFLGLSAVLVAANVDSARRVRAIFPLRSSRTLVLNEIAGTATVVLIVLLPWILGGIDPTREDLTWSLMLAFAAGFLSVCALVLTAYDMARERQR